MSQKHEAEAQLTQERIELNRIENTIKALIDKKISSRAETTLAFRSVQLATMWLGKAKGTLKVPHPYPESFDPNSKVIEARVDVAEVTELNADFDEIAHIKALRADLKKIEGAINNDQLILTDNRKYQECIINAWTACCNATMWLGMVLNSIKSEEKPAEIVNVFLNKEEFESLSDTKKINIDPLGEMKCIAKKPGPGYFLVDKNNTVYNAVQQKATGSKKGTDVVNAPTSKKEVTTKKETAKETAKVTDPKKEKKTEKEVKDGSGEKGN